MKDIALWNVAAIVMGLFLLPGISRAAGVDWPRRPVEVVVPFRPGGDTDFFARVLSKYVAKELNATFTIINMDGAGGVIGAQHVASARPDGYKVFFMNTGVTHTSKLTEVTDLDHNSFAIAAIGSLDHTVLVANKQSGITSAKDFLAKAKAMPGELRVAVTVPAFSFFSVCKMQAIGNFTITPVDYGGGGAALAALVGNQVPLSVNSYGVFKQYIDKGDLIPLLVTSEKRNPIFPDVPTVSEVGLAGAESARAYGFAFPKGTEPQILKKLSDAVGAIQKNPEFIEEIKNGYCVEPFYRDVATSKQYLDYLLNDMAKYKDALMKK
ncbi:MAG: tripartite tricarboxylate transporter substrate binding protein [Desulfovibrionaceae bacterium]|nr:tripartite tricarboxylate transporter substrate binding protein [Desulfovibrionaceae bacterium]